MLVFIDETGDHNLLKVDMQYPLFALGALLISEEEYAKLNEAVERVKKKFFSDSETFILHSSELKRPTGARSDPRNAVMFDAEVRRSFYAYFDKQIISTYAFKVLACFVRKPEMLRKYSYPTDPYHFSFENILNRILRYGDSMNLIYAEKRGSQLDTELLSEYERLCKVGIRFYSQDEVQARTNLKIVDKKQNMNGLQVIDLLLASLARSFLGKEYKMEGNDVSAALVQEKYACKPTVFP